MLFASPEQTSGLRQLLYAQQLLVNGHLQAQNQLVSQNFWMLQTIHGHCTHGKKLMNLLSTFAVPAENPCWNTMPTSFSLSTSLWCLLISALLTLLSFLLRYWSVLGMPLLLNLFLSRQFLWMCPNLLQKWHLGPFPLYLAIKLLLMM